MELKGKNVLVVGAARSGSAAARFLLAHGAIVSLNDIKNRKDFPSETWETLDMLETHGAELILGRHAVLAQCDPDFIVVSPGVPLTIPPLIEAKKKNIPIYSEMELAARFTKAPMVVVTGTNGKTTTTALLGQMFAGAGKKVFVGGNIGVPFIYTAEDLGEEDVAVLEASSFQLETSETFKPRVSLILNLTPDHIDRHGSFEKYIEAKARIFANQGQDDWLILNWDDENTRRLAAQAETNVVFFSRRQKLKEGFYIEDDRMLARMKERTHGIIRVDEINIKGGHNLENALAAAAAGWLMGLSPKLLEKGLKEFPGVPHRLERVLIHKEIEYVNDSKGTNPDASIKALEAYENPIVLIAGGKNKGSNFGPFAHKIKEKVKAIVLVGQAADEIKEALEAEGYTSYTLATTFKEAVFDAARLAIAGDVVLLSPGCASWDMFESFEQRGDVFKKLVHELAKA